MIVKDKKVEPSQKKIRKGKKKQSEHNNRNQIKKKNTVERNNLTRSDYMKKLVSDCERYKKRNRVKKKIIKTK